MTIYILNKLTNILKRKKNTNIAIHKYTIKHTHTS